MVSCVLLILGPLWSHFLTLTCRGEELPRDAVLSLFRERVLEGLGPEEPPQSRALGVDGYMARPEVRLPPWRALRTRRMAQPSRQSSQSQETFQIILFPRSGEYSFHLKNTTQPILISPSVFTQNTLQINHSGQNRTLI